MQPYGKAVTLQFTLVSILSVLNKYTLVHVCVTVWRSVNMARLY